MLIILFLVSYWAILALPGAALDKLIHTDRHYGPLGWIAMSYCCFVILFITSNYVGLEAKSFSIIISIVIVASLLILLMPGFRSRLLSRQTGTGPSSGHLSDWIAPSLTILFISAIYQVSVGAHSEVPADLYNHLERFQLASKNLLDNSLGTELAWSKLLQQKSAVFYYLVAFANQLPGLDTRLVLELIDFSNRTLFLLAIFFFTRILFYKHTKRTLIAFLATVFVTMHMGISLFSFVRYYSFAPTMLAMVLYFFAVSLFLQYIHTRFSVRQLSVHTLLILLLTVAAAAVHTQEAMFIAVMIFCISIVATVSQIPKLNFPPVVARHQTKLIAVAGVLGFTAVYIYSAENLTRAANAHWRLWEFGEGFWFVPQLTTLNLKLQFIQVVTLWGLLVYLLFFINIKRYRGNLFLLAGMLSPLVTFLNPFFIDTFLRNYNSTTVWRLCYLLPIHFVAADLFIYYASKIQNNSFLRRSGAALVVALFVLLLAPLNNNTWQGAHYSRVPTLIASDPDLSYANYNDLLDFLNTLKQKEQVLTDPMLGYMISGLTKHYSARRKFFRDYRFKRFSYYDYSNLPLDRYDNHLLVVNQRPKKESRLGELGQHWRKNEWQETRHYYPKELLAHITKRPDTFSHLWSNEGVSVYRINRQR